MGDFLLIDGDLAQFQPNFGMATVVVRPGTLRASGPATVRGRKACVVGDEGSVTVPGCLYTTAVHSIPGTGTLTIAGLALKHRASVGRTGGIAFLLKGSAFIAAFDVQAPAMQPPPGPGSPIPDSMVRYSGSGGFVAVNTIVRVA